MHSILVLALHVGPWPSPRELPLDVESGPVSSSAVVAADMSTVVDVAGQTAAAAAVAEFLELDQTGLPLADDHPEIRSAFPSALAAAAVGIPASAALLVAPSADDTKDLLLPR